MKTTTKVRRQSQPPTASTGVTRRQRAVVASRNANRKKLPHRPRLWSPTSLPPSSEAVPDTPVCSHCQRPWQRLVRRLVPMRGRIRVKLVALLTLVSMILGLCTLDFNNPNALVWCAGRKVHEWLGSVLPPAPAAPAAPVALPASAPQAHGAS